MANRLYDKYRQALDSWSDAALAAAVDLKTDTIKVAAVSSSYTPNTTTDQFFTSISAAVVGTPQAVTWTSGTAGVYKGGNVTFPSIPASANITYLVVYKDTGTAGTSALLALFDTATNLPYTQGSSAGPVSVTWDATNGLWKP